MSGLLTAGGSPALPLKLPPCFTEQEGRWHNLKHPRTRSRLSAPSPAFTIFTAAWKQRLGQQRVARMSGGWQHGTLFLTDRKCCFSWPFLLRCPMMLLWPQISVCFWTQAERWTQPSKEDYYHRQVGCEWCLGSTKSAINPNEWLWEICCVLGDGTIPSVSLHNTLVWPVGLSSQEQTEASLVFWCCFMHIHGVFLLFFSRAVWLMAVFCFLRQWMAMFSCFYFFSAEKWISDTAAWMIVNSMLLRLFTDPTAFSRSPFHSTLSTLCFSSRPAPPWVCISLSFLKKPGLSLLTADGFCSPGLLFSPAAMLPVVSVLSHCHNQICAC